MKNKPVSHKNQNTFRFLTFAERLNKVNIDVIRQGPKVAANPEDANTFFQEALEKWVDLNYTEDYMLLQKEIGTEVRNLSQIIFRQDEIIAVLLKYLENPESMALDATLELVVALARDLQYDFYPHFPKFFTAVTNLLQTKDTELLEKLFTCLSYLFKFLWRYMIKDMKNVYGLFSCLLLDTNKEYIRNFAAESFAFLIRKVSNKPALFAFMFSNLNDSPMAAGIGQLLFEVVKGVKGQLHSCAKEVLKMLLESFAEKAAYDNEQPVALPKHLIEQGLLQMLKSMSSHVSKPHSDVVLEVFCEVLSDLLSYINVDTEPDNNNVVCLGHILNLLSFWVNFNCGLFITQDSNLIQILIKLSKLECLPYSCMSVVTDIVSVLLMSSHIHMPVDSINVLVTSIYTNSSEENIFQFTKKMFAYGMFQKDVLPKFLAFCVDAVHKNKVVTQNEMLNVMSEMICVLRHPVQSWENIKAFSKLQLSSLSYCELKEKNIAQKTASADAVIELFLKILEDFLADISSGVSLAKVWNVLVCLPHFRSIDKDVVSKTIENVAEKLYHKMMDDDSSVSLDGKLEHIAFLFCETFIAWACINYKEELPECFALEKFISLIKKHPNSVSILLVTYMHFKYQEEATNSALDSEKVFSIIFPSLLQNLASPFHLVRLHTLKLLNLFTLPLPLLEGEDVADFSVFNICLRAEMVPLNVQDYREKLKWLQKLEFPYMEKYVPVVLGKECKMAPIYYLLGMLYVNFNLLWKPCEHLLQSFADGISKIFWDVFKPYLYEITEQTEKSTHNLGAVVSSSSCCDSSEENSFFADHFKELCGHKELPDILNHRNLLWKTMELFPGVIEPRNKEVVPLLFKFVENEMKRMDTLLISPDSDQKNEDENSVLNNSENVLSDMESEDCDDDDDDDFDNTGDSGQISEREHKRLKTSDNQEVLSKRNGNDDVVMSETANDSTISDHLSEKDIDTSALQSENDKSFAEKPVVIEKKGLKRKKDNIGKQRRYTIKTLGSVLSVFAKFKNPKAIYRTEDLQNLYYELLCYPDFEIQKLSFDCIMTYNYKYLIPYKESLYKILDNRSFKSEIVLFSLDEENGIIHKDHRMNVLTVLMRILYGKMLYKTGNNTAGKTQALTRRSLVLRFLAGCHSEELKMFFELVFAPFQEQLNGDVLSVVRNIRRNLDLSSAVPVHKQRSVLNTLVLILQHLGSLIPGLLPFLLKALLAILTTSSVLLEKRQELQPYCLSPLKSVRTLAVMCLIKFFKSFEQYNFTPEEIDAIFEAIVWPMLPRLENESLYLPSPLLRLFDTWSSNSRFFVMFAKQHNSTLSPLPHLMSLYTDDRAKPRVIGLLSKMFLNLLTLEDFQPVLKENVRIDEIKINNCIPVSKENCDSPDPPSFGTCLLLPFIDQILKRLHVIVIKAAKNPKRSLNARDLKILLRISQYVQNSVQCSQLIELLIPFLMRQQRLSTDCETLILSTICNLMKKVPDAKVFIKKLAPAFSIISGKQSRLELVRVYSVIAEKHEEMQDLADTVEKINAYSVSAMEEPDYQSRLDGHSNAVKKIQEMSVAVDEEFNLVIIFNSVFVIQTVDDLSLRDSASYLLQQLIKKMSELREVYRESFQLLIIETLLQEIQKGLQSKTDAVRSEFIRIFAVVLHNCGTHPRLSSLVQLCDKDKDMDFWENILHLQVHRRARALLRFASRLSSNELIIPAHILMSYIMPIVSSFLFDSAYKKHVHVVDAAIETIGVIARVLPWPRYETLLRQYLFMLSKNAEHHKTVVKVVVAILNAFHFNINSAHTTLKEKSSKSAQLKNEKIEESNKENESEETLQESMLSEVNETDFENYGDDNNKEEKKNEQCSNSSDALSESKATKIYNTIMKGILPQLHRSLMSKTKSDDGHKLAGNYYPEDEEILRVPIALAVVKLLQNLPEECLKKHLPGLFLKMCHLLKSRSESIRETTRDTLVKMVQSLGPKYFWYLLREMKSVLKKGYQVHVMTFTINSVLSNLKSQLTSGDLDTCVANLSEVCMNDLFSDVAEEKEVAKITRKLKEARSSKSYSLYEILSTFVSEGCLLDLISPLKEMLSTARSHKVVKKIQECLRHIALGLSDNEGLSVKARLIFIHAVSSEHIPNMNRKSKTSEVKVASKYVRPDIYIIPKEPGRAGPSAKTSVKTNAHVLVEFGLQLLHFSLKRDKLKISTQEHLEMLDPFVLMLTNCLESDYIKVISTALRSLMWIFKLPLPSVKIHASKVTNLLFILLNKYAGIGMGQGENFEMVVMCFKMFAILVRETDCHKLNEEQLHVLLTYVEQDIYDHTRQATAFSLLKAILCKKLQSPDIPGVMKKITEMSITSEQDHIRSQCRQVSLQYILDYAQGKQIENSISFYVSQLEYMYEFGRISALEMINSMLESISSQVIKKYNGLFFIPLGARLVNDEAPKCRKMSAFTIKKLLEKIDNEERESLFQVSLTWLKNKKLSHSRLGAQLCGIFAEVEGSHFENHLEEILPAIKKILSDMKLTDEKSHTDERCTDHFLYHVLCTLKKILSPAVIRNDEYDRTMNEIYENLQRLILYPHVWVRLCVSQLFELLFSSYTIEEVLDTSTDVLFKSRQKLRDLSADFCTQLQSPYLDEAMGDQIIKNLTYLGKIISHISQTEMNSSKKHLSSNKSKICEHSAEEGEADVTLSWMVRRLCREAKTEVAQNPQCSVKRKCVFKFLAALAIDLDKESLYPLLAYIYTPLCRELSDSSPNADESLKTLAQEVLDVLRNVIGVEEFTKTYAIVQSAVLKKKAKRKQERVTEAVTNPEKYSKKRIKKQLNKKESKKRKIMKQKGQKKTKKFKLSDLAIES